MKKKSAVAFLSEECYVIKSQPLWSKKNKQERKKERGSSLTIFVMLL